MVKSNAQLYRYTFLSHITQVSLVRDIGNCPLKNDNYFPVNKMTKAFHHFISDFQMQKQNNSQIIQLSDESLAVTFYTFFA